MDTTHAKLTKAARLESGITDGLIRVSAGIEDIDDIIADLEQAFEIGSGSDVGKKEVECLV